MLWTTCIICLIGFRRQLNLHTEWFLFVQEQNSKNIICPMTLECSTRLADITRLRIGGGLCDIGDVGLSPYVVHQIWGRTEIRHPGIGRVTFLPSQKLQSPFFQIHFSTSAPCWTDLPYRVSVWNCIMNSCTDTRCLGLLLVVIVSDVFLCLCFHLYESSYR